jgi:nitrogen fixation/metabolism regulation signal transduction histidine kinase
MRRQRQATRRAWLISLSLALPAFVFAGIFLFERQLDLIPALLLCICLLIYVAFCAAALVDTFVRPLQTLSNVVYSLREGDYAFRARGAGSGDALGELSSEINALADLLQRQRVRSLEATALLARILEVMHAPLFAFDRNDRLRLVNSAGMKILDRPQARCMDRTATELGLNHLLAAPDESMHAFGDTYRRWLLRKASFRQDGAPHVLLVLADVSVPLQEEERAAWTRLIRVLGHELSNSLAPIKSIAGSLRARVDAFQDSGPTSADFRRGLGIIEGRADSLHRFVQSYRMLAQLPPPRLQLFSLGPLVERVALLNQRVVVRLEPGPAVVLNADPDQLEQMLINLLANAADASLANGSQAVYVSWALAGSNVQIVIEDEGLGIANPENLFVPFYTTKAAGSGIGLALAQQIARGHGGEVALANREDGAGARAIARLPFSSMVEQAKS